MNWGDLSNSCNATKIVAWPWPLDLPNTIGVLFVDGDNIKIRTNNGDDVIISAVDENQNKMAENLTAIIAKTILEKSIEK